MSQDVASSRKEKKALRDAERQRKGKKRKHAETAEPEDGGTQSELEKDFIALPTGEDIAKDDALAVKVPKSKKRKQREEDSEKVEDATTEDAVSAAAPKPKKHKKTKPDTGDSTDEVAKADDASKKRNDRFVVFIGNLPYNTTDASLQAHFKSLLPFTLRHRMDPKTKKSKGFAFIEFEGYDRMKTCLKLYHHSMFDPEEYKDDAEKAASAARERGGSRGKKSGGRRINVELTAGGGGKKEGRMEKIKAKNVRLEEQRARRTEQEQKEKARGERKAGASKTKKLGAPRREEAPTADVQGDTGSMHPSRLAMMNR